MALQIYTWFAVYLTTGLAALAVTAYVIGTDEGLNRICTIVRRRRGEHTTTTTLEGHHHEHDSH